MSPLINAINAKVTVVATSERILRVFIRQITFSNQAYKEP
jgi:hypothetical protein